MVARKAINDGVFDFSQIEGSTDHTSLAVPPVRAALETVPSLS